MNDKIAIEQYSYSKIDVYEKCPYKFKLIYKDGNFINSSSISTVFGTLVHYTEECIAKDIQAKRPIDYDKYIDNFINLNDSEKELFGVKKIKEMFPDDFYKEDKSGMKFSEKCAYYLNEAIYRLESYLKLHPELEIIGIEREFNLPYEFDNSGTYNFHGFIDRVFRNTITNEIIIEDIKTYSRLLKEDKLTTPLQFVFYTLALKKELGIVDENLIKCYYDIPLCSCKQEAGTRGFLKRGCSKINKLITSINSKDFHPVPSPLCHWCHFCATYPNQPEEAKNLCPYYSKWTPDNKTFEVEYVWLDDENHEAILEDFRKSNCKQKQECNDLTNIELPNSITNRFFKIKF